MEVEKLYLKTRIPFSSFALDDLQKAKNFYGKTLELNAR